MISITPPVGAAKITGLSTGPTTATVDIFGSIGFGGSGSGLGLGGTGFGVGAGGFGTGLGLGGGGGGGGGSYVEQYWL